MSLLYPRHKTNDPKCSCVDGQYECWYCRKPKLDAIIARQTPAEREYDRLAMSGWRSDDDDDGRMADSCSCHISAPCGYCVNRDAEDEGHRT